MDKLITKFLFHRHGRDLQVFIEETPQGRQIALSRCEICGEIFQFTEAPEGKQLMMLHGDQLVDTIHMDFRKLKAYCSDSCRRIAHAAARKIKRRKLQPLAEANELTHHS